MGELHIRGGGEKADKHDGPGCVECVPVWSKETGYVEDMLFCLRQLTLYMIFQGHACKYVLHSGHYPSAAYKINLIAA